MPTSPRSKFHPIRNKFQQIRNSFHRADVGIGPYRRRNQPTGDCHATSWLAMTGGFDGYSNQPIGDCHGKRSLPRNDRVVDGLRQERSWVLRFSDEKALRFALSIGAVMLPR